MAQIGTVYPLLDRFLFIFFAEDSGLLPPNSISRIVKRWNVLQEEDAYKPLYDIFKQYFGYINTGRKGKSFQDDIFAYNGGLFFPDEVLDNILIDDNILHLHVMKLTAYDFQSDIDVNILGHIFENSLNEIENVIARLEGKEVDKNKTKRKKDGVFYTPKYITKYIVENTVGKLCEEKKAKLGVVDEEYAKGRQNRKKETLKKLDKSLQAYREWLLKITICDPACGSGAFLNQALEFLITEHAYIDELQAQLIGASIVFQDVSNHILEKNIFGVDINEESVDIAKLSLWLRTAQKGRKLTSLNNNLKCGNSLIDDPAVAGEKAFNWQKEFPQIFKEKDKKAWHVVFAIHNSRYVKFTDGLTRRFNRFEPGFIAYTYPKLNLHEEEILAGCLNEVVKEKQLNILACNICEDHVHAIIVCDKKELEKNIGQWKGRTAYLYNRRVNPSIDDQQPEYADGTKQKLWAKSFHPVEITDDTQMQNTLHYIKNNREKHELPAPTDGLTRRLKEMICTPEHAFRTEYKGGFNVVIGNPPYVQEQIEDIHKSYYQNNYKTIEGKPDLYRIFIENGLNLIHKEGYFSFITPNSFLTIPSANKLRELIKQESTLEKIINFEGMVFETANINTVIFVINKPQKKIPVIITNDISTSPTPDSLANSLSKSFELNYEDYMNESSINVEFNNPLEKSIIKKLHSCSCKLADIAEYTLGLQVYHNTMHNKDQIKNRIYHNISKIDNSYIPEIGGRNIERYRLDDNFKEFVSYGEWCYNKPDPRFISDKRILIREIPGPNHLICTMFTKEGIPNKAIIIVRSDKENQYSILGVLNSRLIGYYIHKTTEKGKQKLFPRISLTSIKNLPMPTKFNKQIEIKVSNIMSKKEVLTNLLTNFLKLLISRANLDKPSNKLKRWNELNFKEFLKELKKAKVQLSLPEEAEWMQYFNEQKQKAQEIKSEIDKTDKEIDRMVYELYGLSEDEIRIVEGLN